VCEPTILDQWIRPSPAAALYSFVGLVNARGWGLWRADTEGEGLQWEWEVTMLSAIQFTLHSVRVLLISLAGFAARRTLITGFGYSEAGSLALVLTWLLALCLVTDALYGRGSPRHSWLALPYSILAGFSIGPVMLGLQLSFDLNRHQAFVYFMVLFLIGWAVQRGLARVDRAQWRLTPQ
jgi:hypothetical protein